MVECPSCGHENIDGVDYCAVCQADLFHLGLPETTYGDLGRDLTQTSIMALDPELELTVNPEDTVSEVIQAMCQHRAGAAMVVFQDQLVGIFTERDFLMKIADRPDELAARPIREFMTPDPEYLEPQHSIAVGLNKMAVQKYRHVPVVRDDKSLTCVRTRDVLKYIVKHKPE